MNWWVSQPGEWSLSVVWWYSSRYLCICCQTVHICDVSNQDAFYCFYQTSEFSLTRFGERKAFSYHGMLPHYVSSLVRSILLYNLQSQITICLIQLHSIQHPLSFEPHQKPSSKEQTREAFRKSNRASVTWRAPLVQVSYSYRTYIHLFIFKYTYTLWICVRGNVSSRNNVVMIKWSTSTYQQFNIWETLSINFELWAPSIDVINTESTSPHPAVVLHSVSSEHSPPVKCASLIRHVIVETGLCGHNSLWFHVVL